MSLAGDSLLQTLSKYTCYSFPTRQRRLARPDKAIYPPPAQPEQTLSLMFSLLQEINMFESRQTALLCQAGSSPFSGATTGGPWQQMYTSESNKRRFFWVNTGHNQQTEIHSAKNEHSSPYVPRRGWTLFSSLVSQAELAAKEQTAQSKY